MFRRKAVERVILRPVFHIYTLVWLISCANEPIEVPAPIDASLETGDIELREFVGDMHARATENTHSATHRGRLGMVYDANGFTEAAALTYGQARELDADDMRWPYLEGLALAEQGKIEEALRAMDLAIRLDSSYVPAYLARGYWLIDLGEFQNACDTFDRASKIPQTTRASIAVQLGLAQCQVELGETEAAKQTLDTLPSTGLPAYADFVRARVHRANNGSTPNENVVTDSGDLGQITWPDPIAGAVVEYTRGLSNESLLAQKLIDGGRAEDALQLVDSLRIRHPEVTYLIELRSAALIALDRRVEAITVLENGLRKNPDEHLLHFNLGLLLDSIGQMDEALDHYSQAIRLQRDFVPAYDAKAKLLIRQGSAIPARDVLNESLEHRLPDASTHNLLGVLYGGMGDWERSVDHLANATRLEPQNVDALVSLALSLGELQRNEEAVSVIQRAGLLDPENPKVARGVRTLVANGVLTAEEMTVENGARGSSTQ